MGPNQSAWCSYLEPGLVGQAVTPAVKIYSNQSSLSPEVTSKSEIPQEELEGGVKTLSQKLSAALLNISIKEDLVKQHSKVAEEAVEGITKAGKNVS
ncbi:unnamed protein product [Lactuca virosa]|uniref:Uncharacterized protein n=1 Tax=Lactuca virosa TaxID=75947 RepID=A0AAU9NVS7_9ASTR|nr:unnamed protein product [Lactuca virosa]